MSTTAQSNTFNIEMAARTGKPAVTVGTLGNEHILYMPYARDVPEPEPVATDWLNGRPPGGWVTGFGFARYPLPDQEWEEAAIVAARTRERRLEWRP